jgi:hypothetical protein
MPPKQRKGAAEDGSSPASGKRALLVRTRSAPALIKEEDGNAGVEPPEATNTGVRSASFIKLPAPVRLPARQDAGSASSVVSHRAAAEEQNQPLLGLSSSRTEQVVDKPPRVHSGRLRCSWRRCTKPWTKLCARALEQLPLAVAISVPLIFTFLAHAAGFSIASKVIAFVLPLYSVLCFLIAPVGPEQTEEEAREAQKSRRSSLKRAAQSAGGGCSCCINDASADFVAKAVQLSLGVSAIVAAYATDFTARARIGGCCAVAIARTLACPPPLPQEPTHAPRACESGSRVCASLHSGGPWR